MAMTCKGYEETIGEWWGGSYGVQALSPKMIKFFIGLAKAGKAEKVLGDGVYVFYRGDEVITLVSLDPPVGFVRRLAKVAKVNVGDEK